MKSRRGRYRDRRGKGYALRNEPQSKKSTPTILAKKSAPFVSGKQQHLVQENEEASKDNGVIDKQFVMSPMVLLDSKSEFVSSISGMFSSSPLQAVYGVVGNNRKAVDAVLNIMVGKTLYNESSTLEEPVDPSISVCATKERRIVLSSFLLGEFFESDELNKGEPHISQERIKSSTLQLLLLYNVCSTFVFVVDNFLSYDSLHFLQVLDMLSIARLERETPSMMVDNVGHPDIVIVIAEDREKIEETRSGSSAQDEDMASMLEYLMGIGFSSTDDGNKRGIDIVRLPVSDSPHDIEWPNSYGALLNYFEPTGLAESASNAQIEETLNQIYSIHSKSELHDILLNMASVQRLGTFTEVEWFRYSLALWKRLQNSHLVESYFRHLSGSEKKFRR